MCALWVLLVPNVFNIFVNLRFENKTFFKNYVIIVCFQGVLNSSLNYKRAKITTSYFQVLSKTDVSISKISWSFQFNTVVWKGSGCYFKTFLQESHPHRLLLYNVLFLHQFHVSLPLQAFSSISAMACGTAHWRSQPEKTRCMPPPTSAMIRVWMKDSVALMMISIRPALTLGVHQRGAQNWPPLLRPNLKVMGFHRKTEAEPLLIVALQRRTQWISEQTDFLLPWMYCLVCFWGKGGEACVSARLTVRVCACVCLHACTCVYFFSYQTLGLDCFFFARNILFLPHRSHTSKDIKVSSVSTHSLIQSLDSTSHTK